MKSHKILVVDDVPRNIQILGNILSKEGYQVAYAHNGEQALSIVSYQSFDLILLDIMMPGKDGYEICEILKGNEGTRETPIIFLTARVDMESIIKGFEVGGQDYITKPFNTSELLARVRTHIQLQEQKKSLFELNQSLEMKVNERTQQLEDAYKRLGILEKTKTDFLAIISHELRTPLNGITGLTTLLNQTELTKEQKEYLTYLEAVSNRLARFSDIALLITSLKVNNYEPDLMPTAVKFLSEMAVEQFTESHKDIKLDVEIQNVKEDILIAADADLIRKSLELLMENVVKYAGEDCQILLRTQSNNHLVSIECIDNGPGFNPQSLKYIFELFSTGDIIHEEGSGLSLAAIKLIMDFHNGKIQVNNSKEGGAIVTLSFPKI